jgi:hypothetical protein
MISAPVLRYYNADLPTMVETDASKGVLAGLLSQQDPETKLWHPIAYFSKTMLPAELNYDIHDKEMLAVIRALEEWRAELEGLQTPFQVYSDHRALEYFMTTKKLSPRQARWAELLSRYYFKLMYRSGKLNERADALSRRQDEVDAQDQVAEQYRTQILLPQDKVDPEVIHDLHLAAILHEVGLLGPSYPAYVEDVPEEHIIIGGVIPIEEGHILEQILELPILDAFTSIQLVDKILQENRTSPELNALRTTAQTTSDVWSLQDGLLLRYGKLYVPDGEVVRGQPLRTALIREAHEQPLSGHPGKAKLRQLLQERYYWPSMGADIDRYRSNCHACRRSHVPRDKTPGFLHPLPVPDRP